MVGQGVVMSKCTRVLGWMSFGGVAVFVVSLAIFQMLPYLLIAVFALPVIVALFLAGQSGLRSRILLTLASRASGCSIPSTRTLTCASRKTVH